MKTADPSAKTSTDLEKNSITKTFAIFKVARLHLGSVNLG
jgi:hypothetical protein